MYDDMINRPHHTSEQRPRMPQKNRAAQFAPFAALTGFDGVILETQRQTTRPVTLDETQIMELDRRLKLIDHFLSDQPVVTVTYFRKDPSKSGGAYVTHTGRIVKMDHFHHILLFDDGTRVVYDTIYSMDSEMFQTL
ncbi:MAG: hypothetical protein IKN72_08475 [Clostridia bacterium]|nr:hypothetical protein [Clostridia bacterium]